MPASGEYDAALLHDAPKVDKRKIQEGYSTDILQQTDQQPLVTPSRPNSTAPLATTAATRSPPQRSGSGSNTHEHKDLESQLPSKSHHHHGKKKPFYKTKKGIIIIGAVLVAVIVAAVVGGVVGSRNKGGNGDNDGGEDAEQGGGTPPPASTTPDEQQGGAGGATPSGPGLPAVSGFPPVQGGGDAPDAPGGDQPPITGDGGTGGGVDSGPPPVEGFRVDLENGLENAAGRI